MAILRKSKKKILEESLQMSLLEELPVQPSQSQGLGKELNQIEETSHLSLYSLLKDLIPHGLFGKTCLGSCHQTEEKILEPSSEVWQNAGMGSPTGFLTLNIYEHNGFPEQSHKCEGVSSLSDILETGDVQQKYYLTENACLGILRRAGRKGKKLPKNLLFALQEAIKEFKTTSQEQ